MTATEKELDDVKQRCITNFNWKAADTSAGELEVNRRSARIASHVTSVFHREIDEVFAAWESGETKRYMKIENAVSRLNQ